MTQNKRKRLDSSFKDWITFYGPSKIGEILGIKHSTVLFWIQKKTLPRPHQMKRIKEITKGRIGYTEIIEGSCSPLSK